MERLTAEMRALRSAVDALTLYKNADSLSAITALQATTARLEQHLTDTLACEGVAASLAEANVRMHLITQTLKRLRDINRTTETSGRMDDFYQGLTDSAREHLATRYAALGLMEGTDALAKFYTSGMDRHATYTAIGRMPRGEGLLGVFYRHGETLQIDDITQDPRACGLPPGHPPLKSLIGTPLHVDGAIRGVLYIADKLDGKPFSSGDAELLELLAAEATHYIERQELIDALRRSEEALRRDKETLEAEKHEQDALIRKLQEAQGQLLQSEKMASIGQLAAGVAHEINNPIGYVSSNLGMLHTYVSDLFRLLDSYAVLEAAVPTSHPAHAQVTALKQSIDLAFLREDLTTLISESREGLIRVKEIVQDLKDFSHVDKTEWEWADLHKGLDSTLNIVRNEIKYKAKVVREYGTLPQVECLASQLNQVFMNMLVNAAHAIETQGTITVRTGTSDTWVWVEIADTGKGIAAEHLAKIYDPFFTTKPVGKGTGLGLSLAYSIVQKHRGRIEVTSEIGQGTAFKIWLPINRAENNDSADGASCSHAGAHL